MTQSHQELGNSLLQTAFLPKYGDIVKMELLSACKNKYETEYSGNVSLSNIRQISNTKVNRVSIGSLTHSTKNFDFSLEFEN